MAVSRTMLPQKHARLHCVACHNRNGPGLATLPSGSSQRRTYPHAVMHRERPMDQGEPTG